MKRKHKAWVGGGIAFVGTYIGGMFIVDLFGPGSVVPLLALLMAAWAADKIDPVDGADS